MTTVSHISKEITTTIKELASGRFEIIAVHISGETKRGTAGTNNVTIKASIIQNTLVQRIANKMEMN